MAVRAYALERFGPDNLPEGRPQSDLNAALVPIYLYHRFQTAATSKLIGGMSFTYGDAGAAEIVPPARQRAALAAILETLDPAALDLPDGLLSHLTPSLGSFSFADNDRELFRKTAYPAFDTVAAAETAADLTFDALLHPQRAARLVEFHRRDPANPSLDEILETTRNSVMSQSVTGRTGEIARTIRARYAFALMDLAESESGPAVKIAANSTLWDYAAVLKASGDHGSDWIADRILAFLDRPVKSFAPSSPAKRIPPGSPIGTDR